MRGISVSARESDADAVAEVFAAALDVACAIYSEAESRATTVTAYCDEREWSQTRRRELAAGLRRLRAARAVRIGGIRARAVRRENWAESWKRHFKPIAIGRSLLVKPGWSRRRAVRGQRVVVLDPGLSFGTGQHATTKFCLEQLAAACARGSGRSFLDIGAGSGIVAIAAAQLGCSPVEAFDFDPDAVRVARTNAARNRVAARIRLRQADLMRLPVRAARRFDVVCANLTDDLLLRGRTRIISRLAAGGRLVLAGMLREQFGAVRASYERVGLRLVARRSESGWTSGAFERLA